MFRIEFHLTGNTEDKWQIKDKIPQGNKWIEPAEGYSMGQLLGLFTKSMSGEEINESRVPNLKGSKKHNHQMQDMNSEFNLVWNIN